MSSDLQRVFPVATDVVGIQGKPRDTYSQIL